METLHPWDERAQPRAAWRALYLLVLNCTIVPAMVNTTARLGNRQSKNNLTRLLPQKYLNFIKILSLSAQQQCFFFLQSFCQIYKQIYIIRTQMIIKTNTRFIHKTCKRTPFYLCFLSNRRLPTRWRQKQTWIERAGLKSMPRAHTRTFTGCCEQTFPLKSLFKIE